MIASPLKFPGPTLEAQCIRGSPYAPRSGKEVTEVRALLTGNGEGLPDRLGLA